MKETKIQYLRETLPNFWIINPKNKDYIIVLNRYDIDVVPFDPLNILNIEEVLSDHRRQK